MEIQRLLNPTVSANAWRKAEKMEMKRYQKDSRSFFRKLVQTPAPIKEPVLDVELSDVNCQHPVLIVNPSIQTIICKCDRVVIDSMEKIITPYMRHQIFSNSNPTSVLGIPFAHVPDKSKFSDKDWPFVERRFLSFVAGSYFVDSNTGESYPVYQFVPCGTCDVCQSKKYYSIVQRCQFAYEESKRPMVFCTLTYNNEHYPTDNIPCLRDIQLFKKRLKRHVDKLFFHFLPQTQENVENTPDPPSKNVKFLIVSERGKDGRIHYHCCIYGIPNFTELAWQNRYYTIKLFQYCWRDPQHKSGNFGFVSFKQYLKEFPRALKVPKGYDPYSKGYINFKTSDDPRSDGSSNDPSKAVSYILKYVNKNMFEKDEVSSIDDNFINISTKMGLKFVESKYKEITDRRSNGMINYVSFAGGKPKSVFLTSYYLKKLFPSISKLIPVDFRRDFSSMMYMADRFIASGQFTAKQCSWITKTQLFLLSRFSFYDVFDSYTPDVRPVIKAADKQSFIDAKQQLLIDFGLIVNRLLHYEIDFEAIKSKIRIRDEFFSKFKPNSPSKRNLLGKDFVKSLIINQSKQKL